MKKALFVATYGDFFTSFLLDKIGIVKRFGYTVVCAANFEKSEYNRSTDQLRALGVKTVHLPFARSPYSFSNFKAYRELKRVIGREAPAFVDCHNPVAGALTRLAVGKNFSGVVAYTAHGFFFYKGAPLKNRILYKPIERFLALRTDVLITMSEEDFLAAKKMRVKKAVELVHGMGVEVQKTETSDEFRAEKRKELGFGKDEFVAVCVGECIPRKNQKTALKAFASPLLKSAKLLIVGAGEDLPKLKEYAKRLGIADRVVFTGYRKDVREILKAVDLFLFPSFQEGLSVALLEAMAAGLPVVGSDIRGNRDCIEQGRGGLLYPPTDYEGFAKGLYLFRSDSELCKVTGEWNRERVNDFSKAQVRKEYERIYRKFLP